MEGGPLQRISNLCRSDFKHGYRRQYLRRGARGVPLTGQHNVILPKTVSLDIFIQNEGIQLCYNTHCTLFGLGNKLSTAYTNPNTVKSKYKDV